MLPAKSALAKLAISDDHGALRGALASRLVFVIALCLGHSSISDACIGLNHFSLFVWGHLLGRAQWSQVTRH
jgi:hypothetical protein